MPIGNPDLAGTFSGTVVRNDDPEDLVRVKVVIPGVIEGESAWALPEGSGAKKYGKNSAPPVGATVYVVFVNNNENTPAYRPGWPGKPVDPDTGQQESEAFPEHEGPDVHVFGVGPFRLVIDMRDPQETGEPRSARFKMVKTVGDAEEDIVWIEINEDNSMQIHADNSIGIDAGGILDLVGVSGAQINGRKVLRGAQRPIS